MEINKIYNINCIEGIGMLETESVDMVITSPPYDNLRNYNGVGKDWNFEIFKQVAEGISRVLKYGGVCVWIVNDATIDGSETLSSFKQAIYFKDVCGLNVHDTMIWCKDGGGAIGSNLCYTQNFEYMFVFSKGKPKSVNLIYDKKSKTYTDKKVLIRKESRGGNDKGDRGMVEITSLEKSKRNNWWYLVPHSEDGSSFHPAVYPLQLCGEHIISWSNEGDLILDPFMGSGTTAVACYNLNRNFIGFELDKTYYEKACKRIENKTKQLKLF